MVDRNPDRKRGGRGRGRIRGGQMASLDELGGRLGSTSIPGRRVGEVSSVERCPDSGAVQWEDFR